MLGYSTSSILVITFFFGVKRQNRGTDHPLSFSAGLRLSWSSTPPSPLCLHGVSRTF